MGKFNLISVSLLIITVINVETTASTNQTVKRDTSIQDSRLYDIQEQNRRFGPKYQRTYEFPLLFLEVVVAVDFHAYSRLFDRNTTAIRHFLSRSFYYAQDFMHQLNLHVLVRYVRIHTLERTFPHHNITDHLDMIVKHWRGSIYGDHSWHGNYNFGNYDLLIWFTGRQFERPHSGEDPGGATRRGGICDPVNKVALINLAHDLYDFTATKTFEEFGNIIAHQIGHGLNMIHDSYLDALLCKCNNPHPGKYGYDYCIMYESSRGYYYEHPWPNRWAQCSQSRYWYWLSRSKLAPECLERPHKAEENDIPICGNGVVEFNEGCDCYQEDIPRCHQFCHKEECYLHFDKKGKALTKTPRSFRTTTARSTFPAFPSDETPKETPATITTTTTTTTAAPDIIEQKETTNNWLLVALFVIFFAFLVGAILVCYVFKPDYRRAALQAAIRARDRLRRSPPAADTGIEMTGADPTAVVVVPPSSTAPVPSPIPGGQPTSNNSSPANEQRVAPTISPQNPSPNPPPDATLPTEPTTTPPPALSRPPSA